MSIEISIVIPVYNGEYFIESTLDSLVQQSCKNFEIIVINDGSTDKSLKILNRYAAQHDCITVINTPNQGICMSRNLGITVAKGRYLMFCDHDDTYNAGYVDKALKTISSKDFDFVKFGCNEIIMSNNIIIKRNKICLPDNEFIGDNVSHILYEYMQYHEYIWDGIYKKELIEQLNGFDPRFTTGCEDVDLFLKLITHAQNCATIHWNAYDHYIRRESSTSQKYSENTFNAVVEMYERKMSIADPYDSRYFEYCRIKTRDLLCTVMNIMAMKSCPLHLIEIYHKLTKLKMNKQFTNNLCHVRFSILDIKTYPLLLYKLHCIYFLALACIIKRKIAK